MTQLQLKKLAREAKQQQRKARKEERRRLKREQKAIGAPIRTSTA